jgi:hypothetical protein
MDTSRFNGLPSWYFCPGRLTGEDFENFTPQFSEKKAKSIFAKTANFTIEIAEAYLLKPPQP